MEEKDWILSDDEIMCWKEAISKGYSEEEISKLILEFDFTKKLIIKIKEEQENEVYNFLKKFLKQYLANPIVFKIAYENNMEFKTFYEALSDSTKQNMLEVRKSQKFISFINKARWVPIHFATLGLTYGIGKVATIFRDKKISKIVTSDEFSLLMRTLNEVHAYEYLGE